MSPWVVFLPDFLWVGPFDGDDGIRTHDPLLAGQVLSQLSYTPTLFLPHFLLFTMNFLFRTSLKYALLLKHPKAHSKLNNKSFSRLRLVLPSFPQQTILLRKEVIQPHLPIRLPCYDLTPIIEPTLDGCLLAVSPPALGVFNFHGLTGGVYKTRERIHRGMLTRDY